MWIVNDRWRRQNGDLVHLRKLLARGEAVLIRVVVVVVVTGEVGSQWLLRRLGRDQQERGISPSSITTCCFTCPETRLPCLVKR